MYIFNYREYDKLTEEYNKVKIKCKHCGHKVIIPVWVDRQVCSWCGYYVYRNKKMEFKDNIKKLMKEMK